MSPFRNLRLLTKITLMVSLVSLVFFTIAAYLSYSRQKAFILADAVRKARIISAEAIETRQYLSKHLAKGDIEFSEGRYGLIPVVASSRIGEAVGKKFGYGIRQTSERFRNEKNSPDPFESEVLSRFIDEPKLKEKFAVIGEGEGRVFRYLTPFKAEESCLQCHGDPADAPQLIKTRYPQDKDNAYGYKVGEVIGAASVTIPMASLYERVFVNLRNELLTLGGLFLALIASLSILNRVTIVGPLSRLGEAIQRIVHSGRFEEEIPRKGADEIGVLIDGFNEMTLRVKEHQRNLEESENRFRVLTETARDGIITFLGNGKIIFFNAQAERLFGYSKIEALGMGADQLVHEDCEEFHSMGIEEYLEVHGDSLTQNLHQIPGRRRAGCRFILELALSVAESDDHLMYTAIVREHELEETPQTDPYE